MTLPLFLLVIASSSWILLYFFRNIGQQFLNTLIALGAGSMLAVSLVHIFPESIAKTSSAVFAFVSGFVAIYLIEELLTPHKHDHKHGDHAHEDPHEHFDHVALVSWWAICVHTLLDGVSIRAGMWLWESVWYAILLGVAAHQIPVSLSLAALLRESKFQVKIQFILILLFAFTAPIGYALSNLVLSWVSQIMVGLAAAFAGGSLLYIATTDLLPVIHSTSRNKYLTVSAFVMGVVLMSIFGEHTHEEHISNTYPIIEQ